MISNVLIEQGVKRKFKVKCKTISDWNFENELRKAFLVIFYVKKMTGAGVVIEGASIRTSDPVKAGGNVSAVGLPVESG